MEFDNFLSQPRWQILELIANNPSSPVNISKEIDTSVAYVSQQLKLLEAAGIVKKTRTKATEKGKPRLIYSLSKDTLYITSLVNNFPKKKKFSPSINQKVTMKIWMIDDKMLQYVLEKLFWRLEPFLSEIDEISVDLNSKPKIFIQSKKKGLTPITARFRKEIAEHYPVDIIIATTKSQNKGNFSIYISTENP